MPEGNPLRGIDAPTTARTVEGKYFLSKRKKVPKKASSTATTGKSPLLPILTAEKGEHERAPRAGESYPTSLRATLRAPPSKWAIKAFFRRVSAASRGRGQPRRGYRRPKPTARSDVGRLRSRRAACFLWYFLSLRKKVLSPSGRQPHRPRRSRRVNPPQGIF